MGSTGSARLTLGAVATLALASGCVWRAAPPPAAPAAGGAGWSYEVGVTEGARDVAVHAYFAPGTMPEIAVAHGAERFVRDIEAADRDGRYRTLGFEGGAWHLPAD